MEPLVSVDWLARSTSDRRHRPWGAREAVIVGLLPRQTIPACRRHTRRRPGDAARPTHGRHRVVLYDRRESMWAARMWWLLRAFGHDEAAILDGGWDAWQAAGQPTCVQPCGYPPATFVARPRPGLLVDKGEVLAAIDDPHVQLVDALGRRVHRGEVNEYGRRGHIPGAVNVTAWITTPRYHSCGHGPASASNSAITGRTSDLVVRTASLGRRPIRHRPRRRHGYRDRRSGSQLVRR
jgi:hypothetical protein